MLWLATALAACDQLGAPPPVTPPAAPALISRADLFGDPIRQRAQLSPRGDKVAFVAPRDGVANLWVLAVDALDQARPVTDDRGRGIRDFVWARDNASLLYEQDQGGDENTRLYSIAIEGGAPRALTPGGARAQILGLSSSDPGGVIVTLNQRDPDWPDVFRIDIASGARQLIERNSVGGFAQFMSDDENRLRLGVRRLPGGLVEIKIRAANGNWSSLLTLPFEEAVSSRPLALEAGGRTLLMLDSTDRDRAALVRVDLRTKAKTVLGESASADIVDVWLHPTSNEPAAFGAEYLRRDWRGLDTEAQADIDFLNRQLGGEFEITSRSLDNSRWIVVEQSPTMPPRSYLYDRGENRRISLLFRQRPALEQAPLQMMIPVEIVARDGLTLVSYLTLPPGADINGDARPEAPAPLVLLPHDGPWARDSYGFSALHQWLANRGYAALSVNFRGSTGFGAAFVNAGNREWGGRLREDLLDSVQWAIASGIARADRVAILGQGFGGYATLASLAFSPEQFRCGASFAGPADLSAMVEAAPAALRERLYARVGDTRTPEGRQALRAQSPLFSVGEIRAPLLLAFGERDPRAIRADSEMIARGLRAVGGGLTFLSFPGEGRYLARSQNRLAYLAVLEHFLGDCLGGRVEPVGAAFEGAEINVYDGAVNVPGLSAFARSLDQRARIPVSAPATSSGGPLTPG